MPRRPGPGLVQATRMPHNDRMEDSKMKARILEDATAYAGFFKLRRLVVEHDRFDGGTTGPLVREVLHRSDAAAALLVDGQLVAAAEEERFSRQKHDAGFPLGAVKYCLRAASLKLADVDYVVFYEKPLPKFDRILRTSLATWPKSLSPFREAMIVWLGDKLWMKSEIRKHLPVPAERILFVEHHLSHAASAMFCAPFDSAAVLSVDGVGEWTTTAIGRGKADFVGGGVNDLSLDRELRFPHSLGLLYSAFTAWLGFRVNNGEYKVMGMAPYGEPKYVDKVRQVIRVADDGSFQLDMSYFTFHHSASQTYSQKFVDLFGAPRVRESAFYTAHTDPPDDFDPAVADQCQYYADVAASIQEVTEETVLAMARQARAATGENRLVMAGGVALNSVANGRVLTEAGFDEVYIQPAAGDSGARSGAALNSYHVCGATRRVVRSTLLGAEYSNADTEAYFQREASPTDHRRRPVVADGRPHDRPAEGHRLVPRPLRMGAARVGQPQHSGRPAAGSDEVDRQRKDQVPRAVPALRAGRARGARHRVLRVSRARGRLPAALHADGPAGAGVQTVRDPGDHAP